MRHEKRHEDKQILSIIIAGCGKVGMNLVEILSAEGHDITVIDSDPQVIQQVTGMYDVMGIKGNGASYNVQLEAGIEKCDLVIAVTESDELNLLCCSMAKKMGNCASVARVRNPDYAEELSYIRDRLGISLIINPELDTAQEMARLLRLPIATEIDSFARGHAELVKFKLPEGNILCDKPLAESRDLHCDMLFCGVERGEELLIPDGSTVFKSGDLVSFVATPIMTHKFFKKIGLDTRHVKSCMIVGGSKTSYYLAKELEDMNIELKILERDAKHCEELTVQLPKALILNGDGSNTKLLIEEGIEDVESFVPLTGIDEENVLLTLYAKKFSKAKVITKINRTDFRPITENMDLGTVIYPKYMTTERISAYVRALQNSIGSNIEALYDIFDNRAEALEFKIERDSKVCGKTIRELPFKENLLVACISRDGEIIIPGGMDEIMPGDRVVVITTHTGFKDINDVLK
ncbi:MAG: Trk system potassium transporter TrkA [Lachnospiraceae bacterium]|nr:Trk system potassium transporter TrkA [Lachnospiraceae bacterium]